ncbi:hypothetical protein [Streptacidiphilus sp. P02-A3a]|uniref:hypothetical protein n=1 Tax=Streptacidiphilus sp. P02-A3a TaxID=2704468 RepID=UPI0015F8B8AB|nr:hypothetical protein [Streptacidiphilus sp. P02-A3a]
MSADGSAGADDGGGAEDRRELARSQLALYIETLRVTMPRPQYALLMELIRMYVEAGGGRVEITMDGEERELFTREVQKELLTLLGLLGALEPGHEDRGDLVVAELGDGEHVKGAMSLVPVAKAENPEELLRMREQLDTAAGQRRADTAEVEAIARASGMLPAAREPEPEPEPEPDPEPDGGADGGGQA